MVGDSEVLIPPFPAGLRHHFKRVHAIGQVGMRMQDAPHIAIGYEGRQLPLDRTLDLAASLPQLGLNEWQAKRCIDVFFAARCEHLAPAQQPSGPKLQAIMSRKHV